ncbi:hypothetical protein [Dellaglioa carnosa]|uniref:Lipoprotein n=1 Tax=Dellaglioa carnosa TaxID=2995136 RepID=A0ABT4JM44_9LACO|nr:hypothetical protein [Dellaglioa carnosa]MCZ2491431.1 hypothetical protein [Dellaglioa carnosa]MCZ2494509.1 hypothetical protein [Dellaglioa carnosa]MDK1731075.1 hypothetical protein [Dellaglioa carnosa]
MKKIKLGIWGLALLLVLVGCSNGSSEDTSTSSSVANSKSTKKSDSISKEESSKLESSRAESIKKMKIKSESIKNEKRNSRRNTSEGTLTVQQMKDTPEQSAIAIAYYGADHVWSNLSGEITDGFNVSIESPDSSIVKYYIQKGDSPYYRLLGDEHNTVDYYSNSDNELQKVGMSEIVTYVNRKLSDDARNKIVNNVTIGEGTDTQKPKTSSSTNGKDLSIEEAVDLLNNKFKSKISGFDIRSYYAGTISVVDGSNLKIRDGHDSGTYEAYGNGGWQISIVNGSGGAVHNYYMVPDHDNLTVSVKAKYSRAYEKDTIETSTITR